MLLCIAGSIRLNTFNGRFRLIFQLT
jgi:hypothetical protein